MDSKQINSNAEQHEHPRLKLKRYYCPHENCSYKVNSARYFQSRFYLKQHLLKVHTERNFKCEKCEKFFPSEQQKSYHEKNCGIEWKCTCGSVYKMRETLLTHVRRTNHQLPIYIQPPKRKRNENVITVVESRKALQVQSIVFPSSVIILPAFQNCDQVTSKPSNRNFPSQQNPMPDAFINQSRFCKILPKAFLPVGPERSDKSTAIENTKMESSTQTQNENKCHACCNTTWNSKRYRPAMQKSERKVAATQTSRRSRLRKLHKSFNFPIMCESRASQCTPKQSTKKVCSESIETQTENILARVKQVLGDKIPFKRNARKALRVDVSAQSVLSCLDLLLGPRWKSRCSSETQTSPRGRRANSPTSQKEIIGQTEFGMLGLLATVCQQFNQNKDLNNIYSDELGWNPPSSSCDTLPLETTATECTLNAGQGSSLREASDDWNQVERIRKSPLGDSLGLDLPSTTIESQTDEGLDEACVHLLTNMETQTSNEDELLFPELEISDTQTQTPWPDIMDFCCNMGHLSAEIQTDITGSDIPFGDWSEKNEKSVFHDTETQTQDPLLPMLQLTSSYTQTLDEMCDYFGFQEKS